MEELQSPEKSVNWIRPNLQNERSEIERTLREFISIELTDTDIEKLTEIIEATPTIELTDEEWEKLDNTDSFHNVRPDHIEDVEEIIEKYNQDQSRGNQRSVELLVDGFNRGKEMEIPVILKNEKGETHLISGNTRLMVARALKIRPRVIIAEFQK